MDHEDTFFTPEAIDEQIDRLRSDSYLATSSSSDAQMLEELRSLHLADESRLEHIWGRLAAKAQQLEQIDKLPVDIQHYQQRKLQDQLHTPFYAKTDFLMDAADIADIASSGQWREQKNNDDPFAGKSTRKKTTVQRLSLFLTQLVAVLIIGSLIAIPVWVGYQNTASPGLVHQTQQNIVSHSVYLSNDQGIMGIDTSNGQGRWTYTIPDYALGLSANPIVGNGLVYAESQDSIYAIDAATGVRRWSHTFQSQLSPYLTNKSRPVLSKNALYVSTVSMEVDKLDAINGKILQIYKPQLNTNIVSIAVANNTLYAFGLFDMCAVRLSDGEQLWYKQVNQSQVLGIPHIVGGMLYTIASSNRQWPYIEPNSTSHIEAFEADSGNFLWQSSTIHGSATDISIANGILYDGSTDGSVSAYDAKNGAQIWSKTIAGMSFSGNIAPLLDTDILYMVALDRTMGYQSMGIIALDAASGNLKWQYPSDIVAMKSAGHRFKPPVVQNGIVFVDDSVSGQDTSELYALFSGAVLWHRTIG